MIGDTDIHLFLRGLLLDGIAVHSLDTPVLFENIDKKNLPSTFIVEQLIPRDEVSYSDDYEDGYGLYKLTVFADVGTGLLLTRITDTLKSIFKYATYDVDTEAGVSLCIDKVYSNELLYEEDSDKVQKTIAVQYRKIRIK
jgi:hypothetical protein